MKEHVLSNRRNVFILIAICSFVLYGNTLVNQYNFDDAWAFQDIEQTDLVTGIKKSFSSNYVNVGDINYGYRPITSISFKLEQALFGKNPFVSHLINLLLYVAVCYAFFLWLHKHVKLDWWLALTATMIFLLFPIHTEVVNSVKNRDELLSALFALGFLIWLWKYAETGKWWMLLLSSLLLAVSVFSKMSSLPLLAVGPIGVWLTPGAKNKRVIIGAVLPILLILVARVIIGKMMAGESSLVRNVLENPLYGDYTGMDRFTVALNSFGFYLAGLFSLGSFSAYYGSESINFLQLNALYVLLVITFLVAAVLVLVRYMKKRDNGVVLFAFIFLFLCVFPLLNLFFKTPGVVGERLVFLSSMGMALLLAIAIHHVLATSKKRENMVMRYGVVALLGVVVLVWSVKTIKRNREWYNLETLMAADLETYPKSIKMNVIMGSVQLNSAIITKGKVKTVRNIDKVRLARAYFQNAVDLYENHAAALYNIAWIDTYVLNGDVEETKRKWQKLVALGHFKQSEVEPFLLHLKRRGGETSLALDESLKACRSGNHEIGLMGIRQALDENNWTYLWAFSDCLYPDVSQRRKQLTEMWKRLYQTNAQKASQLLDGLVAQDKTPYFKKVKVQFLMGQNRFDEAKRLLEEMNAILVSDYEVKVLLANVNISLNNKEAALQLLKEAQQIQPGNDDLKKYIQSLENDTGGIEN